MYYGLKSQTEINERQIRKIPGQWTAKYIVVYGMDLDAWKEFQIFETTESKWTICTFMDYFIVMTYLHRSPDNINGTLVLGN